MFELQKDIMEWKWTCLPHYCTNILGQKMFQDEIKSWWHEQALCYIQSVKNQKMITFPSNVCFRLWPFKWIKVTKYDMTAGYKLSPCYVSKLSLKRYLKKCQNQWVFCVCVAVVVFLSRQRKHQFSCVDIMLLKL